MTTPAFYARIQPSPEDRVAPWQLSAILAAARARLDAVPATTSGHVALQPSTTRLCDRCKRVPVTAKKALFCFACGIEARKASQRAWYRANRKPAKEHQCLHCPTILTGPLRVCEACIPKMYDGGRQSERVKGAAVLADAYASGNGDLRKALRLTGQPAFIAAVKRMAANGKCVQEIMRALKCSRLAVKTCAERNGIEIPAFDTRKNGYALSERMGRYATRKRGERAFKIGRTWAEKADTASNAEQAGRAV